MRRAAYSDYNEMYQKNEKMVLEYIRRSIHHRDSDVEDLAQEVFLVAYLKWEDVKYYENIPGFLVRVAQNKIKKWFDQKKMLLLDDEAFLDALEQAHNQEVRTMDKIEMDVSMESMISPEDMQILRSYYFYDYTAEEIAGRMEMSKSCVKMRAARAKEKLRKSIHLGLFSAALASAFLR